LRPEIGFNLGYNVGVCYTAYALLYGLDSLSLVPIV